MASSDLEQKIANLSPAKKALLARKRTESSTFPALRRVEHRDGVPLSFAQQRIWLIHELDPQSHLYNVPRLLRLTGKLDKAALEASLNEIIRRHEALRTTFRVDSGDPKQIIALELRIDLPLSDAPFQNNVSPQQAALDLALEEYRRPFDLSRGPLLRARLWRIAEEEHLLLLVMHHIVSDGWSGGVLFGELGALYQAFATGRPSPLPELPVQYADYAVWQRSWLERVLEQQTTYWRDRLAGAPPTLELPTDHPRPSDASYRGRTGSLALPPELAQRVIAFSQAQGVTLFAVMLAALQVLLYRWTGQEDLVVGTVSANRNTAELEQLIGCFINFLALRERLHPSEPVQALLARGKQTILEAYAHQDCPFEKVVEVVNPERASNVNPLYNVALLVQNYPPFAFRGDQIEARFLSLDTQVAFLDIRFIVTETAGSILLESECNADLFDRPTVDCLLAGYRDVLEQVLGHPDRKLDQIRIPEPLAQQAKAAGGNRTQSLTVAATFTAEPLQTPLDFWMKRLGIPAKIQFAPFNQVFQQLLDPTSLLASNRQGLNVILCRVEDLVGSEGFSAGDAKDRLTAAAEEFVKSLRVAAQRGSAPYLVCLCPSAVRAEIDIANACDHVLNLLASKLKQIAGISVLMPSELFALYPVADYQDDYAWQVGRIPYTPVFFTALATMIARRVSALRSAPHQVIVIDCDQTLWKGDLRETSPSAVEVDRSRRMLQEFMIAQQEAGKVLCLCGKQSNERVSEVFENNPGMRLRSQHITDSRINELPASENLKDLARELGIELNHFIFVSSSPGECAEARANVSGVTVAQLPADTQQIPHFLSHFWPFDDWTTAGQSETKLSTRAERFVEIAMRLSTVDAVGEAIESEKVRHSTGRAAYAPPRTGMEELLVDVWARLLRVEQPGIRDNFFALGGHSLLAVQVIARIRQILGVEMPLRAMFDAPTIAEFAQRLEAARGTPGESAIPALTPAPRQGSIPLSFSQQRLWFIDQLEPGNPLYNISAMYRMWGPVNVEALQKAINEIVRRHESLRTTFPSVDGNPVQVIAPELQIPLRLEVRAGLNEAEREAAIQKFARDEALRSFDLSRGPLLRFSLLRLAESEHVLVVILHHIVGDGWSGSLLAGEMAALYEAFSRNRPSPLPELTIQYPDFAIWQRQWMQGSLLDAHLAYWKQHLAGAPPVLELPTDRPRPAVQNHRGSVRTHVVPRELLDRLRTLSQHEGATLFMTLLSAFQLLLSRYSGQEDIVVGSTIAGRNYAEIEPLIGFFVNTLAMRTDLSGDPTFRELLTRVRQVALDAWAHQEISFEKLVEELQPERSLSYNPIFQVLFGLQNLPWTAFRLPASRYNASRFIRATSLFDMSWFAFETPEGLLLRVEYDTDLFEEATIARALGHFEQLLAGIVARPESRISELPLLSPEEQHQILVQFNDTATDYPKDLCVHDFLSQKADHTPDAVALISDEVRITYRELNQRANQVAHFLRKRGAGPEVLVGIYSKRTAEMVIGILGILKAGSAYVPLDPAYPKDRLANILEDARAPLVLTQQELLGGLPRFDGRVICMDTEREQIARESQQDPITGVKPENLAYVLFTSGSTGRPKGVALEHHSAVTFIRWVNDLLGPHELSGVLSVLRFASTCRRSRCS